MLEHKVPRRKTKTGRKIALVVGIAVLALLVIGLIVKWDTIWSIFNIGQLEMRPASEMRTRIKEGPYTVLTDTGDELTYTAADGAVTVTVLTEDDDITQMKAEFNAYDLDVSSYADAEKYARELLSPYYTDAQIEAMVVVIAGDVGPSLNAETIDYSREIGGFSVNAAANVLDGDVRIEMTRSGAGD